VSKNGNMPAAFDRGVLLATMLHQGKRITTALIRERFGTSQATAKRDLLALEVLTHADADVDTSTRQVTLRARPEAAPSARVDCGECPRIRTGCQAGHCLRAAGAAGGE